MLLMMQATVWGAVDLNADGHLNYLEFCAAFQVVVVRAQNALDGYIDTDTLNVSLIVCLREALLLLNVNLLTKHPPTSAHTRPLPLVPSLLAPSRVLSLVSLRPFSRPSLVVPVTCGPGAADQRPLPNRVRWST